MMKIIIILLVLNFLSLSFSAGNYGVDRPYNDLPNQPTLLSPTSTIQDCANLCNQTSECVAWAMNICYSSTTAQRQCWLKQKISNQTYNLCRVSGIKNKSFKQRLYEPLFLGEIMPQGWLQNQLNIQAEGLSGNLAMFWNSINTSLWIGGNYPDPGEQERVPYWLNGIVPLAYQTQNETIIGQAERYIDYILQHQTSDGWFGPYESGADLWPAFPFLMALTQYLEANPSLQPEIIPKIYLFLNKTRSLIMNGQPLTSWAQYRSSMLIQTIYWLYDNDNTANGNDYKDFLLDLAEFVYYQGFNWGDYFTDPNFPHEAVPADKTTLATHGVNVGMGIKDPSVWARQAGDNQTETYKNLSLQSVKNLYTYHGLPQGIFCCSEHLCGLSLNQGSETCTVVETMFSFETMFSMFGDLEYQEYLEKLTFNALPAALTPDMWAHVYLHQTNQINSQHCDPKVYITDGPDSNIYGLEPNFGCCTANFNQGWPKFVSNNVMKTQDGGLIIISYSPALINTTLKNSQKSRVIVNITSQYPFNETISIEVSISDKNFEFPLYFVVPSWTQGATLTEEDFISELNFSAINQILITKQNTQFIIKLPMKFQAINSNIDGSYYIQRGPLIYSLKIEENFTQTAHYYLESNDYQIEPLSPWNYALQLDLNANNLDSQILLQQNPFNESAQLFSHAETPIQAFVQGKQISFWVEQTNAAQQPPQSPVSSNSSLVNLTLIPFGAGRLRIGSFPILASSQKNEQQSNTVEQKFLNKILERI